jgi:hypothetical protein
MSEFAFFRFMSLSLLNLEEQQHKSFFISIYKKDINQTYNNSSKSQISADMSAKSWFD